MRQGSSNSRGGRCAFVVAGVLSLGIAFLAGAQEQEQEQEQPIDQGGTEDSVKPLLEALAQAPADRAGAFADRGQLLQAGYAEFIARMDSFDGEAATALARALYAEDPAIWSAFCLEGALRRSASADADSRSSAFQEAFDVLEGLRDSNAADPVARVDITNRIAILAAGFGVGPIESAALGRSLSAGGVDGAQIAGLAALRRDPAVAARLFGSLLDRSMVRPSSNSPAAAPHRDAPHNENSQDDESVTGSSPIENLPPRHLHPEAAPWALRGHALATLEQLRGPSPIQD